MREGEWKCQHYNVQSLWRLKDFWLLKNALLHSFIVVSLQLQALLGIKVQFDCSPAFIPICH